MSNKAIQSTSEKGKSYSISSKSDNLVETPLNKILEWYDSQDDDRIITEFTNLTTFFHPDETIRNELKAECRKAKFREYLKLSQTHRREIARRSLMLIGVIDLVIETKRKEEQTLGIHDIITVKWSDWSREWETLRNTSLMNEKISDWFFNSKIA